MKIYLTTIAIVGLLTSIIPAAPSFSLGLGVNTSRIAGTDSVGNTNSLLLGYTLNMGFEQSFSERFTLRTGFSLETRGEGNLRTVAPDPTYTEDQKEVLEILNLQIPVLAQVNFPLGIIGFHVFGGPELGIFLNGERRNEYTSNFPADGENPARSAIDYDTTDFSSNMKMLDLGLRVGVGFELNTGNIGAFFIRPSAYIGLIDILQTGLSKEKNANLNGKHQAFSAAIGYKFNINPKMNSATSYKSSPKKQSTSVKEEAEYNPDNYKGDASTQENASESEPAASEVDDLE